MKTKILTVLFTAMLSMAAVAQGNFPRVPDDGIPWSKSLTVPDFNVLISKVANPERQKALKVALDSCSKLEYLKCHVALFDLEFVGLTRTRDEETDSLVESFPNDFRSNRIYNGIKEAFAHPQLTPGFDIQLKPLLKDNLVPSSLDFDAAISNPATKEVALRMVENHFRAKGATVNVRETLSKSRGEYIRLLSYGYALRGDGKSAMDGLELLKPYGKNGKDAWVVKHTRDRVQFFLSQ